MTYQMIEESLTKDLTLQEIISKFNHKEIEEILDQKGYITINSKIINDRPVNEVVQKIKDIFKRKEEAKA